MNMEEPSIDDLSERIRQVRILRYVSLFEGATLAILLCVAVPLKYLWGVPEPSRVMGAVHGLAFLTYIWILARTAVAWSWRGRDLARMIAFAAIPFGAFFNAGALRSEEAQLTRFRAEIQSCCI